MTAEPPAAIVTGGGRGIGRAAAVALSSAGHPVAVNDTGVALDGTTPDPSVAAAVAAEIEAGGGAAVALPDDLRTPAAARRAVSEVAGWAGRPATVLVHAAGTLRDGMLHKAGDEDWSEVLGSHLEVAVSVTRAIVPAMRASGFGRAVYVGGAAGLVGNVGQSAYVVAKAALFGLTRALALELAGRDACVTYLVPFARTRMTDSIPPVTDELREYLATAGRTTPGDVGSVVAWLCSPGRAGLSGQVLGVRGAEVAVWSQPRPAASQIDAAGWDASRLKAAAAAWEPQMSPLESEFDLLRGRPAVATGPGS